MKKGLFVWIAIIAGISLLGYGISYRFIQQNREVVDTGRMQVVASFYPLAHIAEQVGKEFVSVLNLTPAGSEPHDFDPSPRDVGTLQGSRVFVYNGAGLEPWVTRLVPELEEKGVMLVEASKELPLIAGDAHEHEEEHEEDEHEEGESEGEFFDPHVWLDPVLFSQEVNAVASAFVVADPLHASEYMGNARVYTQELEGLHQEFTQGLASCKRRDIVTSHAAFGYLAARYNITMVPISGISPDEEPTPARLAEISDLMQERGITHIFFESLVSPKLAETISTETGAQAISLNPLEGLTDEDISNGKTYITVQRENLEALRVALDCL